MSNIALIFINKNINKTNVFQNQKLMKFEATTINIYVRIQRFQKSHSAEATETAKAATKCICAGSNNSEVVSPAINNANEKSHQQIASVPEETASISKKRITTEQSFALQRTTQVLLQSTKKATTTTASNVLLVLCVYACASFVYLQVLVLAMALKNVPIPPGFVFMALSLAYIGYIIFKVSSFIQKLQHITSKHNCEVM